MLNCFYFDTDKTQKLDCYQQFPVSEESTVMGVSTSGPRRLVLLYDRASREQDWCDIRSYPDLCKHSFSLADEDPEDPQRVAEVVLDESPLQEALLELRPALVHIRLRSLTADFSRHVYADEAFNCTSLYLGNAVTECQPLALKSARPAPLSWVNCGFLDSVAVSRLPHPEMLYQEGCGEVGRVTRVLSLDFYCYPSPSLQLVLGGKVGPDACYYPVPLGPVNAGETYELNLILTRKGVESPEEPLQAGTVSVNSIVEPWGWQEPLYVDL